MRRNMLLLGFLTVIVMGCDDSPSTATITGTITFDNIGLWSTWQDSGEVQVTIFPDGAWTSTPAGTFPVAAPVYVLTLSLNDTTPTYDYSFKIEPGTYSALSVGFRHDLVTDQTKRSATLGVHWGVTDSVSHGIVISPFFDYPAPSSFSVEKGDELMIDFRADFAFVNVWQFR